MTDDKTIGNAGSGDGGSLEQNPVKDPEEWTTGDEPMTGPQASYLRTLLQQSGQSGDDLDESMTKAEASKMIDQLQQATGRDADEDQTKTG